MTRTSRFRRTAKWIGTLLSLLCLAGLFSSLKYAIGWGEGARFSVGVGYGGLGVFLVENLQPYRIPLIYERGIVAREVYKEPEFTRLWRDWALRPHWARTATGPYATVPIWMLLLLFGSPTVWLWVRDRQYPLGRCQRCGYDLTGNVSGVCSECGTQASSASARPSSFSRARDCLRHRVPHWTAARWILRIALWHWLVFGTTLAMLDWGLWYGHGPLYIRWTWIFDIDRALDWFINPVFLLICLLIVIVTGFLSARLFRQVTRKMAPPQDAFLRMWWRICVWATVPIPMFSWLFAWLHPDYDLAMTFPLLWVPIAIIAPAAVYRCRRPHRPGHCQGCGYNLTGNTSGICPECEATA